MSIISWTQRIFLRRGELEAYSLAVLTGLFGGWVAGSGLFLAHWSFLRERPSPDPYDPSPLVSFLEGWLLANGIGVVVTVVAFLPVWGALLIPAAFLLRHAEGRGWQSYRAAGSAGAALGYAGVLVILALVSAWAVIGGYPKSASSASDLVGALSFALFGIPGGVMAGLVFLWQMRRHADRHTGSRPRA